MHSPDKGADVNSVSPKKAKKNGIKWSSSFAFDEWVDKPPDEDSRPVSGVPDVLKEVDRLLRGATTEHDIETARALVVPLVSNLI